MSNLHKDLDDLQLHNPKGFAAAANDTKLQSITDLTAQSQFNITSLGVNHT